MNEEGFERRSPDVWRWPPYKHATCNYAGRGICMQMGKRLAARFAVNQKGQEYHQRSKCNNLSRAYVLNSHLEFNKRVCAAKIIGDIDKVRGKNVVKIRKPSRHWFPRFRNERPRIKRTLNALQDSITKDDDQLLSVINCIKKSAEEKVEFLAGLEGPGPARKLNSTYYLHLNLKSKIEPYLKQKNEIRCQ
ncbi:hypothetical protein WN51_01257 [Melipona quadrifasciata]|uniref:Uncharacterized protein n=1 Tax=Melipona quadrifasciata TaxID=166423 RepID=A0A0N0BF11_9HYME|nr:hypothetical protein WN51_01257 [Melipona quadrifasciata]